MDIGGRLKAIRETRGLSQRELASRAKLTNGAISLIEQNKSSPSVESLTRLLDAIPMSLSEFFSGVEKSRNSKYFYAASEFVELSPMEQGPDKRAGVSLRQLGDAPRHTLQLLTETYSPGADTGPELLTHEGEKAGVVIEGFIEVTVADQTSVLNPGDGYLFDCRLPHRFRNIGRDDCVIVSACTPPTL